MARIGFFHPAFQACGGAELLCIHEARGLIAGGDSVELVTLSYDASRWAERMDGLAVRVTPKHHWQDLLHGFSRLAKLRSRARRAAERLRDFDSVLAFNHPTHAMLGAAEITARKVWQCNEPPRQLHAREANPRLTARASDPRVEPLDASTREWRGVLEKHDRQQARESERARRVRFDIEMTGRLDHVFAISEFSRDNARRIYGRCADEVVYPIVRFPAGGWTRASPDRSRLNVLVHSRLDVPKNIDTVIRGFAAFQARHTGAHLHVVGEGPDREELERLAASLMPAQAFTFHGFLPEARLQNVYERCDVFALLTLDEPFGMVFPEAAAKGLLLIGPDHGGPLEILEGGRLGWCVDPFDPAALDAALEEAGSLSHGEAERRRAEADRSCRARFSEAVIVPKLRRAILEGRG